MSPYLAIPGMRGGLESGLRPSHSMGLVPKLWYNNDLSIKIPGTLFLEKMCVGGCCSGPRGQKLW